MYIAREIFKFTLFFQHTSYWSFYIPSFQILTQTRISPKKSLIHSATLIIVLL